jgi:hypothetical protein
VRNEKLVIIKYQRSMPKGLRQVRAVAGGFRDNWPTHGPREVAYEVWDRRVVVITHHNHAASHRNVTDVILKNTIGRYSTTTIAHPRKATSPTTGNLARIVSRWNKWIPERKVEMNWAGVLFVACNSECASHDGTHVQSVRHIHLHIPTH